MSSQYRFAVVIIGSFIKTGNEEAWWAERNINALTIAKDLWGKRGQNLRQQRVSTQSTKRTQFFQSLLNDLSQADRS